MFFIEQSGEQSAVRPFDLRDQGLLLADGVFDTSLIVHGTMILRAVHLDRLINDAFALNIAIDHQRIDALLAKFLTKDHSGVLRITVTSGPAERGIVNAQRTLPTVLMNLSPVNRKDQFKPISLQTSHIRRNSTSLTSRHKTLAYTDNVAAFRAAQAKGYDDALFLNTCGNICCTTMGNLFLKIDDIWVTPPVSDGVLPGVMRQWLLGSGSDLDIKTAEESITANDLKFVKSAFMVNSIRLAAPILKINARELEPRLPERLKAALRELTGRNSRSV
jgi:branched-chain amino acid aminotransferase